MLNKKKLVVFGTSNILSDIFDAALAAGFIPSIVVTNTTEGTMDRSLSLEERFAGLAGFCDSPAVVAIEHFEPKEGEVYVLGPTTPQRDQLVAEVLGRFDIEFYTLIHPTAYISPLAKVGKGVFVGANSVIGPGANLADYVFINRGATVGHDTSIGGYSRVQPGCNLGGLSKIGKGVTIGIGATVIERLEIGDGAFIGAGAVVTVDVPARVLMVGCPATVKKSLA